MTAIENPDACRKAFNEYFNVKPKAKELDDLDWTHSIDAQRARHFYAAGQAAERASHEVEEGDITEQELLEVEVKCLNEQLASERSRALALVEALDYVTSHKWVATIVAKDIHKWTNEFVEVCEKALARYNQKSDEASDVFNG